MQWCCRIFHDRAHKILEECVADFVLDMKLHVGPVKVVLSCFFDIWNCGQCLAGVLHHLASQLQLCNVRLSCPKTRKRI